MLDRIREAEPVGLDALDGDTRRVIARMLAKRPSDRFATVTAATQELLRTSDLSGTLR